MDKAINRLSSIGETSTMRKRYQSAHGKENWDRISTNVEKRVSEDGRNEEHSKQQ